MKAFERIRRAVVQRAGTPELVLQDRVVRTKTCPTCGKRYRHVTGSVGHQGHTVAAYFASCGAHSGGPEVGIDATLGTWGFDAADDHVTFSCRTRPDGSMAVDAPVALSQDVPHPILGRELSRDEALSHPWVGQFWHVVDAIILEDPDVGAELRRST